MQLVFRAPSRPPSRPAFRSLAAIVAGFAVSLPLLAQQTTAPGVSPAAEPTVTEELIRMLAEHNALSPEQAQKLIGRLRGERAVAAQPPAADTRDGTIRVPYLSETQKSRIREEVKQEVMATAKAENWAQPNAFPDWLNHITIGGDLRARYEADLFDHSNSPQFINYQAINSGNPFDVNFTNGQLPPLTNTTEDRRLLRMRARLDIGAKVADDLSTAFRLTTGNNTNPVSTNQTLGTDFNKLTFVIDRAYFDYHPRPDTNIWLGRMPNPWFAPTELQWDEDLNFDGIAAQYRFKDSVYGMRPFVTAGAFSVENTTFDFPSNGLRKISSRDKWLFGAQAGFDARMDSGLTLKQALAFYYYYHLEGSTSSPCEAINTGVICDTDNSRPGFLQKGNTLFALRDLVSTADNLNGPQYQYFGLASPFRILDLSLQADQPLGGPLHLVASGEAALNLGYNRDAVVRRVPVNGYSSDNRYHGGGLAGQLQLLVGHPVIHERWEWNALGGYRRAESDAVVDAFTDSDFNLGGTNTKGFYLRGALGFTHNAWLSLRWLSATEIEGAPLAADVLQLDVNARF